MNQAYRCIVTGRAASGESVIVRDTMVPTGALGCADFWKTATSPASLANEWVLSGPIQLEPPASGTIFRFFEIPPQASWDMAIRRLGADPHLLQQGSGVH